MSIALYEEALKSFDWWYEHSDSQEVYLRGRAVYHHLQRMRKLYDEDFTLWNYYAPKEFQRV